MYVDESGDCGILGSPTRYFVLTGLVVHELAWATYLDQLIEFRRRMSRKFGLGMREEFHAAPFLTSPGKHVRIPKNDRLTIIRNFADHLGSLPDLNLICVAVDKAGKSEDYDVFELAWKALVQRFENTISHRNFSGPQNPDDRGMIFPDRTDDKKLTLLLRRMRRFNPIPNQSEFGRGARMMPMTKVIEDPSFRDSEHSLFIQACDLAAFVLYQHIQPNAYMKKKSGQNYFLKLEPILCKRASARNPLGIVWL